jgi:hypothetical protein
VDILIDGNVGGQAGIVEPATTLMTEFSTPIDHCGCPCDITNNNLSRAFHMREFHLETGIESNRDVRGHRVGAHAVDVAAPADYTR